MSVCATVFAVMLGKNACNAASECPFCCLALPVCTVKNVLPIYKIGVW